MNGSYPEFFTAPTITFATWARSTSSSSVAFRSLDQFVKDSVPNNLALRGVGDGSFAGNQKGIFWFNWPAVECPYSALNWLVSSVKAQGNDYGAGLV